MKILEKISNSFFEILKNMQILSRLLKFWRIFEDFWRIWRLLRNDKIFGECEDFQDIKIFEEFENFKSFRFFLRQNYGCHRFLQKKLAIENLGRLQITQFLDLKA
jgi:hypothetical protein